MKVMDKMARVTRARSKAKQSGKLSKAERVANQDAADRHERARCAIQIATTFLENYAANSKTIKVINPINPDINPDIRIAELEELEEFNK